MKLDDCPFYDGLIESLFKIMNDKHLNRGDMAEYAGVSASQFGKVLTKKVAISFPQLSKLAQKLSMREIDLFTYPEKYAPIEKSEESVEVLLQIKLTPEDRNELIRRALNNDQLKILKE